MWIHVVDEPAQHDYQDVLLKMLIRTRISESESGALDHLQVVHLVCRNEKMVAWSWRRDIAQR